MQLITQLITRALSVHRDPLYMNSIYMMASMAAVSGSGFFFWLLSARLYPDVQVGLATAIISVITFIMNLSILGLNYSIIRFLPKSKDKNQLLSGSFLAISVAASLCAGIFLLFLPFFSPKLVFIRENTWTSLAFLFFTITVSIDFATESIFLAYRAGKYILIKNLLVSALKLFLPIFFVSLGAIGIFMAWAGALTSALLISFFVLIRKFNFRFTPNFKKSNLPELFTFSFVNYLVGLLGIAPALIIPVLITNVINPQTTAYFYIAFMIAGFLYVIPYATTQSLFAEGSYDEFSFLKSVRKACVLIGSLMIPAILILVFFGNYILLFFGKSYSSEGIRFLQIMAVSGIPVSLNYVGLTYVNVKRRMKALLVINIIGASTILGLSFLLSMYSLTGIGIAWLMGQVTKNILYGSYIGFLLKK